jgi:salicylate hydroxylase
MILQSGERVVGDLVVVCDGVKSIARKVIGKEVEPHETGDTYFCAVLQRKVLLQDPELAHLVTNPGLEQWLGPDHHVIGYVLLLLLLTSPTELIGIIKYNMQKEKK